MRQAIKEQVIVESYLSDNSKQIVLIRALNIGRSQAGIVIQPKETEKGNSHRHQQGVYRLIYRYTQNRHFLC